MVNRNLKLQQADSITHSCDDRTSIHVVKKEKVELQLHLTSLSINALSCMRWSMQTDINT